MKNNRKKGSSLYRKFRLFHEIKLPSYKKASKKHTELINRILSVKDFCLAMTDSQDRELLILELMQKVISDAKNENDYISNVMVAERGTTIFGGKYSNCPGVLEVSYSSHNATYNFFGCDIKDIRILIFDDIRLDNMSDHEFNDIKGLVSMLRQKNKELKVLYIVDDLFINNHYNFYRMLSLLNLNVAKLNHILDVDNFISMFIEQNSDKNGITFKNMKLLEVMLKKHLYVDPLEQVERMKFNFSKVFEIEREGDLINAILQNMMNYNDANKNYKRKSRKSYISDYSKSLNILLYPDGYSYLQNIEKKHYYYKKKDFRIYNENISTGRFSKSKYELHMVNYIGQSFVIINKTNIKTLHIVVDAADDFFDSFLRAIQLLYNGDYDSQVRLFIYFVAKKSPKVQNEEQMISSFDFENIASYRKLQSFYQDMRSNVKLKYDEYKTFDEIMREILGED